jgi:hypothetical protein
MVLYVLYLQSAPGVCWVCCRGATACFFLTHAVDGHGHVRFEWPWISVYVHINTNTNTTNWLAGLVWSASVASGVFWYFCSSWCFRCIWWLLVLPISPSLPLPSWPSPHSFHTHSLISPSSQESSDPAAIHSSSPLALSTPLLGALERFAATRPHLASSWMLCRFAPSGLEFPFVPVTRSLLGPSTPWRLSPPLSNILTMGWIWSDTGVAQRAWPSHLA